jgi:glycine/D-amino acid oxidase-like deaminating enzyme
MRTAELGFWWRELGGPPPPRPPLEGSERADVAIVGAGFTGLWTAYYLARAQPSLRIVVLDANQAGFGASGRNGGWLSGFFSGPARTYERRSGAGSYAALQRAMFDTIEEVASVVARHSIDAQLQQSGQLAVALDPAQLARLRAELTAARTHGVGEQDLAELDPHELDVRLRVAGALGATFTPHVARVQPARLLRGLATTVESLGVRICEQTRVQAIEPGRALTASGTLAVSWIVRATEGYTASLRGQRRALVPMNSSMIITEPLPESAWEQIGWRGGELLGDGAHVYVYLQRTPDGRIAIGGRGVPYRYGSRTDGRGVTASSTVASLHRKLLAMFPAARDVALAHAWSGVLGVPRDWCVSVRADRARGLASAGGYVGEGVAASNLAARTLRDLMLERPSELTELPWVGREPRRWEPEPLRWAAIRSVYSLYRAADRRERRSGAPSRLGALVDALSGRA